MLRKQIEKEKYQLEQDIKKATSLKAGSETPMTATPTTTEIVGTKRKRWEQEAGSKTPSQWGATPAAPNKRSRWDATPGVTPAGHTPVQTPGATPSAITPGAATPQA